MKYLHHLKLSWGDVIWAVLIIGLVMLVMDAFESAHGKSGSFLVEQAECLDTTQQTRDANARWINFRWLNFNLCSRWLIPRYSYEFASDKLTWEWYVGLESPKPSDPLDTFFTPLDPAEYPARPK